jgi:catechol 2,3-dioxygenase-like lactoylglutathione lyase family enzyme
MDRLDHLVLTVADIGRTVEFYERVLGMRAVMFARQARRAAAIRTPAISWDDHAA